MIRSVSLYLVAVSIVFLLAGLFILLRPYNLPPADNLIGTESYRDLGELMPGQTATVTMEIANPFDRAVKVKEIRTSCGCTGAEMAGRTIGPQAKQPITISVEAPRSTGLVAVTVDVEFDNQMASKLQVFGLVR